MRIVMNYRPSVVWIPNPIQQGLKRGYRHGARAQSAVWIPNPIQQGLKLTRTERNRQRTGVWIPNPIQQGLKLADECVTAAGGDKVWIPNPIQQGLKPGRTGRLVAVSRMFEYPIQYNKDWNCDNFCHYQPTQKRLNTQSNTTRIETEFSRKELRILALFEYPIQYNKDWNVHL